MTLFDQMRALVAKTKAEGRVPVRWRIRAEMLDRVIADAGEFGVLSEDDHSILGVPYEAFANEQGQGAMLMFEHGPDETI